MAIFVFANNVNTTLASALSPTSTTIALASSANLPTITPGDYFPLTLNDKATGNIYEICYITAITGASLTVLRGQEGTTALSWVVGDYAYGAFTAGSVLTTNNTYIQNPMTSANDLIIGGANGAPTRLAEGTVGQVLSVGSSGIAWSAAASGGMTNPMTAVGDLITGGTSGAPTKLPIGTTGQVLSVNSGTPAWVSPSPSGMANPMATAGDLIVGGTGGTPTRLGEGANGQVLSIVSGLPAWGNPTGDFLKNGTVAMTGAFNAGGQNILSYTDGTTTIAVTAATTTIDFSVVTGRMVVLNLAANTTLAFANIPTTGATYLTLICVQDSTGGRTLAYPTGTKASGGVQPVLSTAAGAEDWLEMVYNPSQGNWRVFTAGRGMA